MRWSRRQRGAERHRRRGDLGGHQQRLAGQRGAGLRAGEAGGVPTSRAHAWREQRASARKSTYRLCISNAQCSCSRPGPLMAIWPCASPARTWVVYGVWGERRSALRHQLATSAWCATSRKASAPAERHQADRLDSARQEGRYLLDDGTNDDLYVLLLRRSAPRCRRGDDIWAAGFGATVK